ncbi:MAG: hypothetical protein ACFCD0_07545 [Gemmataceae bacterium]
MRKTTCFVLAALLGVGVLPTLAWAQPGDKTPKTKEELEQAVSKVLKKAFKEAMDKSFNEELGPKIQQIVVQYTKRELGPLTKSIEDLKAQVEKLEKKQDTGTLKFQTLKSEVDTIRTDIGKLKVQLEALVKMLEQMNSEPSQPDAIPKDKIANKIPPPDMDALAAKIKKVLGPMMKAEMEDTFATILKTEIKALRKDCQDVWEQVKSLKENNGLMKDQMGMVEKTNSSLMTQMAALSNRIDAIQKQTRDAFYPPTELDDLKLRIAKVETEMGKLKKAMAETRTAKSSPVPVETSTLVILNNYNEDLIFKIIQKGVDDRVERVRPNEQVILPQRPTGIVTCEVRRDNVGVVGIQSVRLEPNGRSRILATLPN